MTALNVETISFFCLPYLVEVSVWRMLGICFALMTVKFMCCENVSYGSKVISRVLVVFLVVVFSCLI